MIRVLLLCACAGALSAEVLDKMPDASWYWFLAISLMPTAGGWWAGPWWGAGLAVMALSSYWHFRCYDIDLLPAIANESPAYLAHLIASALLLLGVHLAVAWRRPWVDPERCVSRH